MKEEYKHSSAAKILGGAIGIIPSAVLGFVGSNLFTNSIAIKGCSSIGGAIIGSIICASRGNELYNDVTNHIDNLSNFESIGSNIDYTNEYKNSLSAKILGGITGALPGSAIAYIGSSLLTKSTEIQMFSNFCGMISGALIGGHCGNKLYNDIIDHIDQSHIALIGNIDNYSI
jgi:hypothetical protein